MECNLGKGDLLRLDGKPKGVVLYCLKGTVWLTKGDGADYLIPAGEKFEIKPGATAVVEPLDGAEIRLVATVCEGVTLRTGLPRVACRPS